MLDDPYIADRTADQIRRSLDVARVTVRIDPETNLPIVGESLAAGVPSLRGERTIDQMTTDTVRWVVRNRRVLVIDDATAQVPQTPAVMLSGGLRAFLIAPIHVAGRFAGTVSVHSLDLRVWTPSEVAAVEAAAAAVAGAVTEDVA